jgi:hypothetical protein
MKSSLDITLVPLKNLYPSPVTKQWKTDMNVPKHTERQQFEPSMRLPKQFHPCNIKKESKSGSK